MPKDKESVSGDREDKSKYIPPDFDSETIFETRALACGKCRRGPERKTACSVLSAVS